ncbi:MAG: hypothetical protein RRC34_07060 [Lentisphaeria bacterium]|nr:hypothetical protein [Lentisphaeria bacterium]
MKKLLKWLLVVIPIVIIIAVVAVFAGLNSMIKAGVETIGPKVVKAPVTLGKVSLSPFSGNGEINDFIVGNPNGFTSDSSFELGTVKLDIELSSLMSDTVVINEITVDGPKITYERALKTSNLKTILDNVKAFAGGGDDTTEEPEKTPEKPTSDKPAKTFIIRKIALTNTSARVTTTLLKDASATLTIPDILLTDIGVEKGGATSAEVVQEILKQVLSSVLQAYEKEGALDILKTSGGESVKGAVDTMKGLKGFLKKD